MEPDESPRECAVREAEEESGVTVQLGGVLGVLGGPEYRVTYPNGDQTAYVVTVFDATVIAGSPRPDGDETSEVGWFQPEELPFSEMGGLAMALFRDLGLAAPDTHRATEPMLVVVTGLQGSGKSTVAGIVAHALGAPVISHDWAMSGLRPFPEVQATLDAMGSGGHGQLGWSILRSLAQSQLEHGLPVVLDGVARAPQIESLRRLAKEAGVRLFVIMTECSDVELHRSRIEGRERYPRLVRARLEPCGAVAPELGSEYGRGLEGGFGKAALDDRQILGRSCRRMERGYRRVTGSLAIFRPELGSVPFST